MRKSILLIFFLLSIRKVVFADPSYLPSSYTIPSSCILLKYQGNCNSCYAAALTNMIETRYCMKGLSGLTLSLQQLVSCVEHSTGGCHGGDVLDSAFYMAHTGMVTSSCFPYKSGSNPDEEYDCDIQHYTDYATCQSGSATSNLYFMNKIEYLTREEMKNVEYPLWIIKDQIYRYGGVTIVVCLNHEWYNYRGGGILDSSCDDTDSHAVTLIGYTPSYWIGVNSWGGYWGNGGIFKLEIGYDILREVVWAYPCEIGYYFDSSSLSCLECDSSCIGCVGGEPTDCTGCVGDKILFPKFDSTYIEEGECLDDECPIGYYLKAGICAECDADCYHCYATQNCYICKDTSNFIVIDAKPYYPYRSVLTNVGYCNETCNDPFFSYELSESKKFCIRCDTGCTQCDDPFLCIQTLYKSIIYYMVLNSSDISVGPPMMDCPYHPDPLRQINFQPYVRYDNPSDTIPYRCSECNRTCYYCNSPFDGNSCLRCYGDHFLLMEDLTVLNGRCIEECPEEYYYYFYPDPRYNNFSLSCASCHSSCKTCIDSLEYSCTSCEDSYYFIMTNETTQSGQCVYSKPEGFTSLSSLIQECNGCLSCIDPYDSTSCLSCEDGLILMIEKIDDETGSCVSCNSEGQFIYSKDGVEYCVECDPSCLTCNGKNANQCLSCPEGFYLTISISQINGMDTIGGDSLEVSEGYCSDCSEVGYILDSSNICVPCHPNCKYCSNGLDEDKCTYCIEDYYLMLKDETDTEGKCTKSCGIGYFIEEKNSDFGNYSSCVTCSSSCRKCLNSSSTSCTECRDSLILVVEQNAEFGRCLEECPSNNIYNQTTNLCSSCNKDCKSCVNPKEGYCTSCEEGSFLKLESTQDRYGKCVDAESCEEGYYANELLGLCLKCHSSCKTCIGTSSSECSSCNDNYRVVYSIPEAEGGSCVSKCGNGSYWDLLLSKCISCHPDCLNCTSWENSECGPWLSNKTTSSLQIPNYDIEKISSSNYNRICFNVTSADSDDEQQFSWQIFPQPKDYLSNNECLTFYNDTLEEGDLYSVSATIFDSTGSSTFYELMHVSQKIKNCVLSISPEAGIAYSTIFSINIAECEDPENGPIYYEFIIQIDSQRMVVKSLDQNSRLSLPLPSNNTGQSTTVNVIANMVNYFGEKTILEQTVEVKANTGVELTGILQSEELYSSTLQKSLITLSQIMTLISNRLQNRLEIEDSGNDCGGCSQMGFCNSNSQMCECESGYTFSKDCSFPDSEGKILRQLIRTAFIKLEFLISNIPFYSGIESYAITWVEKLLSASYLLEIFDMESGLNLLNFISQKLNSQLILNSTFTETQLFKYSFKFYPFFQDQNLNSNTLTSAMNSMDIIFTFFSKFFEIENISEARIKRDMQLFQNILTQYGILIQAIQGEPQKIVQLDNFQFLAQRVSFKQIQKGYSFQNDQVDFSVSIPALSEANLTFQSQAMEESNAITKLDNSSIIIGVVIHWKKSPYFGYWLNSDIGGGVDFYLFEGLTFDRLLLGNIVDPFVIKIGIENISSSFCPSCLNFNESSSTLNDEDISLKEISYLATSGYLVCESTHNPRILYTYLDYDNSGFSYTEDSEPYLYSSYSFWISLLILILYFPAIITIDKKHKKKKTFTKITHSDLRLKKIFQQRQRNPPQIVDPSNDISALSPNIQKDLSYGDSFFHDKNILPDQMFGRPDYPNIFDEDNLKALDLNLEMIPTGQRLLSPSEKPILKKNKPKKSVSKKKKASQKRKQSKRKKSKKNELLQLTPVLSSQPALSQKRPYWETLKNCKANKSISIYLELLFYSHIYVSVFASHHGIIDKVLRTTILFLRWLLMLGFIEIVFNEIQKQELELNELVSFGCLCLFLTIIVELVIFGIFRVLHLEPVENNPDNQKKRIYFFILIVMMALGCLLLINIVENKLDKELKGEEFTLFYIMFLSDIFILQMVKSLVVFWIYGCSKKRSIIGGKGRIFLNILGFIIYGVDVRQLDNIVRSFIFE